MRHLTFHGSLGMPAEGLERVEVPSPPGGAVSNQSGLTTVSPSCYSAFMDLIYSPAVVRADTRQLVSSIVTHPEMNLGEKLELLTELARVTTYLDSCARTSRDRPQDRPVHARAEALEAAA